MRVSYWRKIGDQILHKLCMFQKEQDMSASSCWAQRIVLQISDWQVSVVNSSVHLCSCSFQESKSFNYRQWHLLSLASNFEVLSWALCLSTPVSAMIQKIYLNSEYNQFMGNTHHVYYLRLFNILRMRLRFQITWMHKDQMQGNAILIMTTWIVLHDLPYIVSIWKTKTKLWKDLGFELSKQAQEKTKTWDNVETSQTDTQWMYSANPVQIVGQSEIHWSECIRLHFLLLRNPSLVCCTITWQYYSISNWRIHT